MYTNERTASYSDEGERELIKEGKEVMQLLGNRTKSKKRAGGDDNGDEPDNDDDDEQYLFAGSTA
jgi:hypothetical protein